MNIYAQRNIESLDWYLEHPDCDVFVVDLKHQAPSLIKEIQKRGLKIYKGSVGNKSGKVLWAQIFTYGSTTPITHKIVLSNKCRIHNYSNFDPTTEEVPQEEMEELANLISSEYRITKYQGRQEIPMTGCQIIKTLLPENIASIPNHLTKLEEDNLFEIKQALRGGANAVLNYDLIPFETHVDYHQLYAYVLKNFRFPRMTPVFKEGFVESEFGLYFIGFGKARLKKDGYPIISSLSNKMAGLDGNWFDLHSEVPVISSVDYKLLLENYEVEELFVAETLVYSSSRAFEGSKYFTETVDEIYNKRKNSKGAVKRFYKLLNEYLPGYFERTGYSNIWWDDLTPPEKNKIQIISYNPIVGIFITAYGRTLLNELLHMFPHDKVIGFDTDCVFFAGKPDEVPQEVLNRFGEDAGQLHFDGIYKDVIHTASKHYSGFDLEANAPFRKASGVSKKGITYYWDAINKDYKTKEVF